MSLIIAVFLVAVLLYKVSKDKAGEHKHNIAEKEYTTSTDRFNALYTNPQLEDLIRASFDDTARLPEIHREIDLALGQMKHWKGTRLFLHPSEYSFGASRLQSTYKPSGAFCIF